MADKRQLTTVTIDTDTGARLERLAKANGVSKKEFIYGDGSTDKRGLDKDSPKL